MPGRRAKVYHRTARPKPTIVYQVTIEPLEPEEEVWESRRDAVEWARAEVRRCSPKGYKPKEGADYVISELTLNRAPGR